MFAVRRFLVVVVALLLFPVEPAGASSCWHPPVVAPVTDPFREPPCAWCPGNRGIEYGTAAGVRVRAVASGTVTFAGYVAGTVYVVVRLTDGRRVTYGNLRSTALGRGDVVIRNMVVGITAGRFHLGLRRGERYLDPAPFIGRLRYRPRLVPADGSQANPTPPPTLTCRASSGGNRRRPG